MDTGNLDLAGIIGKLMQSEESVAIIDRLKSSVENKGDPQTDLEQTSVQSKRSEIKEASNDIDGLAEKLPQVMSALAPLMENGTFGKITKNSSQNRRNDLLTALRPYLNEGRRDMIDKIMTLSRLTGMMDMLPRETREKDK